MSIQLAAVAVLTAILVLLGYPVEEMVVLSHLPAINIKDWNVKPLVKIELVDSVSPCPDGSFDIFNRTWHGLASGCNTGAQGVLRAEECDSWINRLNEYPSMVQSNGLSKKICGW